MKSRFIYHQKEKADLLSLHLRLHLLHLLKPRLVNELLKKKGKSSQLFVARFYCLTRYGKDLRSRAARPCRADPMTFIHLTMANNVGDCDGLRYFILHVTAEAIGSH